MYGDWYAYASGSTSVTTSPLVWRRWNQDYTAVNGLVWDSSSSTTAATVRLWSEWNYAYAQAHGNAGVYDPDAWLEDAGAYSTVEIAPTVFLNEAEDEAAWSSWNGQFYVFARSKEERARLDAGRTAAQLVAEKRRLEREAASKKARDLLLASLDVRQRELFIAQGFFEVQTDGRETAKKGRTYRLNKDGGVHLLDDKGEPIESFCIHPGPAHAVPTEDAILAKKLMLEGCEEIFLKIANKTVLAPVGARR